MHKSEWCGIEESSWWNREWVQATCDRGNFKHRFITTKPSCQFFAITWFSYYAVLRTRFQLWIDLLDRTSFRHDSYFGIDLDPYYIPLSFLSFALFRYCLSDLCSGSLFVLWFAELCPLIHLFLIWLFFSTPFLVYCSLLLPLSAECECERKCEDQV